MYERLREHDTGEGVLFVANPLITTENMDFIIVMFNFCTMENLYSFHPCLVPNCIWYHLNINV